VRHVQHHDGDVRPSPGKELFQAYSYVIRNKGVIEMGSSACSNCVSSA
jgi:hypothetical protein